MVNRKLWFRGGPEAARPAAQRPHAFGIAQDATADEPEPGPARVRPGKRILLINQYYWPDHASTAQHLTDLAESLADRGFECHVLCAQSRYKPGDPAPPAEEVHNGVHIHRVPATSLGRKSTLSRMTDYLSFYARAVVKAFRLPRFDLVVTLTTPPIIGLVGTLLRRMKGSTHVCWSMDLHPDASLALRRMSPRNPIVRSLAWLSDAVLRQADRVVVLGPYMADRILMKRVRPDRIVTIPVWSRKDEVYPVAHASNGFRKRLGFGDELVCMYSGNLGLAHTFDEFLEAARRLRDKKDVVFLYIGGGPRLAEVKAAKERDGLDNVRILDYVAREELHLSLSTADVHLISMRPEMTGIVVPGKLYGIMAAARPALFVGPPHCESADLIRRSGGGFAVPFGDADGVVAALERLRADRNLARQMGEKARHAFIASHEMGPCCYQWFELARGLVTPTRPASHAVAVPSRAGAIEVG
ncbi:glycosyltransferase family 4 protein [Planctomyces sp. SH-PL62]|uniref:glycosyltransferase family 4 protein n=1 Tax=Planctomyces sp. SH-PL62 TaxID=1636152 RepID=UPI00078C3AF5|nr:glycosyltransferase family 4 protein [Planctomyces sp. SH-PL62]AMV36771.1 putative glycosyl transferase [Planctomyces sp. SH-PL62]